MTKEFVVPKSHSLVVFTVTKTGNNLFIHSSTKYKSNTCTTQICAALLFIVQLAAYSNQGAVIIVSNGQTFCLEVTKKLLETRLNKKHSRASYVYCFVGS